MGKGNSQSTSTQSSTTSADPQAAALYRDILTRAQSVAQTPYQSYSGELVAPLNAQQNLGVAGINTGAGFASPYIGEAADYARSGASPVSAAQIQNYLDPNIQNVVNATQAQFNNQNAQQQQGLTSNAISQGALGGNRVGVAQGVLAGQQQLAQAPVIANLYSQGYQQALNAAQADQQRQAAAAYSLGNLGVAGQNAALSGAQAQFGAGTAQQQTQQAQDTANYGQFMQQQGYPYEQLQWLANLGTGVGSALGSTSSGTSTTTQPKANSTAQWLGLGVSALGLLSDERAKEDIEEVGALHDGQKIYRYRIKGDPRWHIGLMAGEVERHHPEAVNHGVAGGYDTVDYKAATDDAAEERARGGVVGYASGGDVHPYSGGASWIPKASMASRAPSSPLPGVVGGGGGSGGSPDASKIIGSAMNLAKGIKNGLSGLGGPTGLNAPGFDSWQPSGVGTIFDGASSSGNLGGFLGGLYSRGGVVPEFADGGAPEIYGADEFNPIDAAAPDTFSNRFGEMPPAQENPEFYNTYGKTYGFGKPLPAGSMWGSGIGPDLSQPVPQDVAQNVPVDATMPDSAPMPQPRPQAPSDGLPGVIANGAPDEPQSPAGVEGAMAYAPKSRASLGTALPATVSAPASPQAQDERVGLFVKMSPEVQAGLLAAGFGMMASRSPNLGNAVGDGALAGLGAYYGTKQNIAKQRADAAKLERDAEKWAQELKLKTESQAETKRHNMASEGKDYKPTFGVIGEDPITGVKQYGWINPNSMTVKGGPPVSGAPGAGPIAGGEEGASGAPSGGINPALTGAEYLAELEKRAPGFAKVVKGVGDYRTSITSLSRRGGMREKILEAAQRYNPDYDQTRYTAKNRAVSNFSAGPEGRTVRSLNVAIDHLNTLDEAVTAMDNGNYPILNTLVNKYRRQTGNPLATNFDSIKQVVSAEIAKAVVGGQTALHDRDDMAQRASNSSSPAQLRGIVTEFKKLMGGQMRGLRRQYESNTGLKNFDDFLEPATKGELSKLGEHDTPSTRFPTPPKSLAGKRLQWNANARMFRDQDGRLYREDGTPAQ